MGTFLFYFMGKKVFQNLLSRCCPQFCESN